MADLKMRTWHYVQNPKEYEIECNMCGESNIEWSEYEGHIWCYDCKKDVTGTMGIFDGPIPMTTAAILGICFDRWDMVNKVRLRLNRVTDKYEPIAEQNNG